MPTNYPDSQDILNNPNAAAGNNLNTAGLEHDSQHSNANDAIEAIEAFVGYDDGEPGTLVERIAALEAGGGGGGGAGDSVRALLSFAPAGGSGPGDNIPVVMLLPEPIGQTQISVSGGKVQLEPGVYAVTVLLNLDAGAPSPPPIFAMESELANPIPHSFPAGFSEVTDPSTTVWVGTVSGTFYYPATDTINIFYGGDHTDINNGLVTVTRLRDI